jgi:predicted nucleotidyltransferase
VSSVALPHQTPGVGRSFPNRGLRGPDHGYRLIVPDPILSVGPHGPVPEERVLLEVLAETVDVLERANVPHLLMGGIASALVGRPRFTHDIDVFVRQHDSTRALEALEAAGFTTKVEDPSWLYKAFRRDVLVDLIFRSEGEIYLDEEMLERATRYDLGGRTVPIVPAEDLVVMKALAHREETPRYWHDALSIVAREELDWDYLIRRALRHGGRRVLALLIYAQSNDLIVPADAVGRLFEAVETAARGSTEDGRAAG